MFRKLICKVRDKLNKGQPSFVPGKHYNILLVDISYLGYADAFQNSFYLRQFGKIAQGCLSDRFDLFDCVVFFYNGMQAVGQYPVALVVKKTHFW